MTEKLETVWFGWCSSLRQGRAAELHCSLLCRWTLRGHVPCWCWCGGLGEAAMDVLVMEDAALRGAAWLAAARLREAFILRRGLRSSSAACVDGVDVWWKLLG